MLTLAAVLLGAGNIILWFYVINLEKKVDTLLLLESVRSEIKELVKKGIVDEKHVKGWL